MKEYLSLFWAWGIFLCISFLYTVSRDLSHATSCLYFRHTMKFLPLQHKMRHMLLLCLCQLQNRSTGQEGATYYKGWILCTRSPLAESKHCTAWACCECYLFSVTLNHALVYSLGDTYLPFTLGYIHVIFHPTSQPDHPMNNKMVIHHMHRVKNKNCTIISTDTEKNILQKPNGFL